MKIIVLHRAFGCETGCCGHAVVVDDKEVSFDFIHPYGQDQIEFSRRLVEEICGAEHVSDLDWDNCIISDD